MIKSRILQGRDEYVNRNIRKMRKNEKLKIFKKMNGVLDYG